MVFDLKKRKEKTNIMLWSKASGLGNGYEWAGADLSLTWEFKKLQLLCTAHSSNKTCFLFSKQNVKSFMQNRQYWS